MDQAEYDRRFKNESIIAGNDLQPLPELTDCQSIIVDGQTVTPLRITVVNSTPDEMYKREMDFLQEKVTVVGMTEGGVELVRREGGADYAGNEAWRKMMRRCGRLR